MSEKTSTTPENTSPENKGEQLHEHEKATIGELKERIQQEKAEVMRKAQAGREKMQEQMKDDAKSNLVEVMVETLVGKQLDENEGKRIDEFLQMLDPEEKKFLINSMTGQEEDPRIKALHARLNVLKESTGDKSKNETIQQIEEFTKGIMEMMPESVKKYEKMIETMINGLVANIAEAIAEWMNGFGMENTEVYEASLQFRLKEIRKASQNKNEKDNIGMPKEEISKLVEKDLETYEKGYRKWMTFDKKNDKNKKPPMTLKDAQKLLEPEKKPEEKKETKEEKDLKNDIPEKSSVENREITLTKKSDDSLECKRGGGAIKMKDVTKAVIETKTGIDGKVTQNLIVTKKTETSSVRVSMTEIDGAFDKNDSEPKTIKTEKEGTTLSFEKIPSSTT